MSLSPSTVHSLVADLRALLGDRVSTAASVREHHGHDESFFPPAAPDAVVFPETRGGRGVVKLCGDHDAPIVAFGAGTRSKAMCTPSKAASRSI